MRFAGYGAFWGDGHPFNASAPLGGALQTNNRAELQALAYVLGVEVRAVDIRTDSAYLQKGVKKHLARWRAGGWVRSGRPIQNADLWHSIASLLENRPEENVKVTKVKGHASRQDVSLGLVQAVDKHGNDCADALAVADTIRNRNSKPEGERKQKIVTVAVSMHNMMLEIYLARAEEAGRQQLTEGRAVITSASSTEHSDSQTSQDACSSAPSTSTAATAARRRRARGRAAPAAAE